VAHVLRDEAAVAEEAQLGGLSADLRKFRRCIENDFGAVLGDKNATWAVRSATVLRTFLTKNFKASDDPWRRWQPPDRMHR